MVSDRDRERFSLEETARGYPLIPIQTLAALARYYYYGIIPEHSFLAAVLRGDVLAVLIADRQFEKPGAFKELVAFLWDHFPRGSWGSGEKVRKWAEKFESPSYSSRPRDL